MTIRRRILVYVATALAAIGVFGGDAAQAQKRPSLKLTVSVSPSTIVEGSTATGTVTHNNSSVISPVTVTLSSNDTTEAIVAATVTIPAGTNTVHFAVTAINDNIADGSQPVTITTAATGYASASTNVTVKDAPTFQYVLTLPSLPADGTGTVYENDINNRGQMVGWYATATGRKGYICDTSRSSSIIDLTALTLPGMPAGYQISSVVGINEHQVLVGYLTNDSGASGNRIAFAVDLAAVNPVVDLLPDMGSPYSYGSKINENGDILGVYTDEFGAWGGYIYNPGLYGNPAARAVRNSSHQDQRNGMTSPLPMGYSPEFKLNNPVGNIPAQVAGTDPIGIAFRYTTGLQLSETFPTIDLDRYVGGINDAGTFCGVMNVTTVVKRITRTSRVPFRYTSIVGPLPGNSGYASAIDINNAGDIIDGDDVYRDTWGWRQLTDLPVIGYDADVLLWLTSFPSGGLISDRVTSDDVGHIAGYITIDGVSYNQRPFVLTPVPVP